MNRFNPSKSFRLLHLPNERGSDLYSQQVGARKAFQHYHDTGLLSGYEVFSFLWEAEQLGGATPAGEKLLDIARRFQPDIIFWQHINDFDVSSAFLRKLKAIDSSPKLVYHEADAYGRYIKRMSRPMRILLSEVDLVFMVGLGSLAALAKEYGAKKVLYAPHNFETVRFGKPWTPTTRREYDVVMIGNCLGTGYRGRFIPGARKRLRLVQALCKRFGERFALYGRGWSDLSCSKGPLPFSEQEEAIRSAWLSINWDHFDKIPFYFSNRLPIALAAGVPHVTTHHPGYEHMFNECAGFSAVRSVEEAMDTATYLLSLPPQQLICLGNQNRQFALDNLEANKVYGNILQACIHTLSDEALEVHVGSPQEILH